jgi:hypothetical protein
MPEFLGQQYTTEIFIPASMEKEDIQDLVKDTLKNLEDIKPVVTVAIAASNQLKALHCTIFKTIASTSIGKVLIAVHA